MEEIWKPVVGYEGLYEVSNLGRVFGIKRNNYLMYGVNNKGYCSVLLSKDNKQQRFRVHRIVAMAFIPNPNNLPYVNHKDEDPLNNCVDNLEWCTPKYNSNYGTGIERCAKQKWIPVKQKTKDGKLIRVWDSIKEAAKALNMKSQANISSVCKGNRKYAGGYIWEYVMSNLSV